MGNNIVFGRCVVGQTTLKNKFPDMFNLSLQKLSSIREIRDNQGVGSQV